MGLFKWFVGYNAAKHLLRSARPRPQPVNIHLHIELPDDNDDMDGDLCCSAYDADDSPNCIYVDEDCDGGPRFFTVKGREVDKDGFHVSDDEAAFEAEAAGIMLPPAPNDAGLLTDVTAMTRAERRKYEKEEGRRMKRRLLEVDRLLKHHTPQEVERILWENHSKDCP